MKKGDYFLSLSCGVFFDSSYFQNGVTTMTLAINQANLREKKLSKSLIIRIDPVTKKRLFFIAEQEGTTASEKIRKMINQAAAHYPDAPSNVTGHPGGK
jgi:hypothetical protein